MKAIVAEKPGGPEVLKIRDVPRLIPPPGWVSIRVMAFGLNRAEMFTRQGHSPGVKFPRILGIECVGVVEEAPGTRFRKGQQVAAIMGGMGRTIDGGYAEYTCVPASSVMLLESGLPWSTLGAIPEMFQTAWGSLYEGLEIQSGETLLIRGGTSSIGMTATQIAKLHGLSVIATTRNPAKADALKRNGVDHVVIDTGVIVDSVRRLFPDGVDRVLELVGTATLLDSLKCAKYKGVVCMTGILGNEWIMKEFDPHTVIPHTVKLTVYSGEAQDVDLGELHRFVDDVAEGRVTINIDRVFNFDEIVEAHRYMESSRASGKLVVLMN